MLQCVIKNIYEEDSVFVDVGITLKKIRHGDESIAKLEIIGTTHLH